jgi:hypothetical protein
MVFWNSVIVPYTTLFSSLHKIMKINISYTLAALHEAAKFIWDNNDKVKLWPSEPKNAIDVMSGIKEMMISGALTNAKLILKERRLKTEFPDDWLSYTGTGGYYFLYELISDDLDRITIGATILVDPAVSHPAAGYITELIDDIEENV